MSETISHIPEGAEDFKAPETGGKNNEQETSKEKEITPEYKKAFEGVKERIKDFLLAEEKTFHIRGLKDGKAEDILGYNFHKPDDPFGREQPVGLNRRELFKQLQVSLDFINNPDILLDTSSSFQPLLAADKNPDHVYFADKITGGKDIIYQGVDRFLHSKIMDLAEKTENSLRDPKLVSKGSKEQANEYNGRIFKMYETFHDLGICNEDTFSTVRSAVRGHTNRDRLLKSDYITDHYNDRKFYEEKKNLTPWEIRYSNLTFASKLGVIKEEEIPSIIKKMKESEETK